MFSLIATVLFLSTLVIALCLPLIVCFVMDWRKTLLMLLMIAMGFILAVGFAVLINMLVAIIFFGSVIGLTIGAIWE